MSRWKDIFRTLKEAGYDVYAPAKKSGECTEKYIVLAISTIDSVIGTTSVSALYDVMLYMPRDSYSQIEDEMEKIREALKKLYPMIISTKFQTPPYYDDSVKAYMTSMQYRNSRRFYDT